MSATWDFWSPTGFQTAFPDRAQEHPHCPSVRQMAAGTAPFTDGETEGGGSCALSVATQLMGVSGRGSGIMVPLSSLGPRPFQPILWSSDPSFCHPCGCFYADQMSSTLGVPSAPACEVPPCAIFKWLGPLFQICWDLSMQMPPGLVYRGLARLSPHAPLRGLALSHPMPPTLGCTPADSPFPGITAKTG